jgi:hypothetical protein
LPDPFIGLQVPGRSDYIFGLFYNQSPTSA